MSFLNIDVLARATARSNLPLDDIIVPARRLLTCTAPNAVRCKCRRDFDAARLNPPRNDILDSPILAPTAFAFHQPKSYEFAA